MTKRQVQSSKSIKSIKSIKSGKSLKNSQKVILNPEPGAESLK